MTAFGKLVRTTAFRLTLVYLLLFAMFAASLLGYFAWNTRRLITEEITQTVNAETSEINVIYDRRGLVGLDPYVACRLRWPDEADRLAQLLRHRLSDLPRAGNEVETIEDVIARRLLVQTPSLLPLVERLALAAQHDVTVLLTGETGSGKTHLARLMHDCSPRAKQPFLPVPCGAIRMPCRSAYSAIHFSSAMPPTSHGSGPTTLTACDSISCLKLLRR